MIVGTLEDYSDKSKAQAEVDKLRLNINSFTSSLPSKDISVDQLVNHYREFKAQSKVVEMLLLRYVRQLFSLMDVSGRAAKWRVRLSDWNFWRPKPFRVGTKSLPGCVRWKPCAKQPLSLKEEGSP
jgi:hypothetical protein